MTLALNIYGTGKLWFAFQLVILLFFLNKFLYFIFIQLFFLLGVNAEMCKIDWHVITLKS